VRKERQHSSPPKINPIPIAQILKSAGLSGFGNIFDQCIRLFSNIIITRTIGASDFGLFSLSMTVVNMGAIIPRFGLPQTITRFIAYYKGKGEDNKIPQVLKQALVFSFLFGIGTAILIYYIAPGIALNLFHREALSPIIRSLSPFVPFGISGMVLLAALQGLKQIKKQVIIQNFIWPLVRFTFIVIFFIIGWKLYGLVAAVVLAVIIRFVVSLTAVSGHISFWKTGPATLPIRKLLFFSAPLVLVNILAFALNWTDTLMLGYFRTPAEVGIYSIAWRLSMVISVPLVAFNNIFSPLAAEYIGKNDNHSLQTLLQTVDRWVLAASLPLAVILALFPNDILSIFGKEFKNGALILQILVLGQLINAATGPCGNVLTMKGLVWLNLVNSSILVIVNFILNLMMIPRYGIQGAALATAISLGLVNIMRYLEVEIFLKIAPYRISSLKPFIFVMLAIMPSYMIKNVLPVFSLILFVAVYALLTINFDIRKMDMLKIPKKERPKI
jgi:O-antigen/teichoic acid export membrane protein